MSPGSRSRLTAAQFAGGDLPSFGGVADEQGAGLAPAGPGPEAVVCRHRTAPRSSLVMAVGSPESALSRDESPDHEHRVITVVTNGIPSRPTDLAYSS